ncbi:MCE family protein [Nocardioides lianchengensis]|uniref:Phospholipid/cholesterol/gamma-HCH transport system substrate-binding protein n=1 Tax=Nocardioides lianchengensis TaxID=1045774 RepID=A0A1G6TYJ7_9ACTN|nr:MCE family protein [Nocardioides lianchengensis]NYG11614.1 phospholipid/cholesterol/gamma-HCH transport system substrate-binding protein [Nocardioides lianchengensis]SDD33437.1 phospholipid/cholesterol/gamma-HCH transport system substrate-binding protein [Nocardioides lianchengensis]
MMVPFRERNPVIIGAVSLAVLLGLLLAAFRAQDLPLIGGGDTYTAAFAESGGLKANDEVRIAGVRVGKVESVELDGDHVQVTFKVKTDSGFGADTRAAIRVKTLLGAMYLALEPAGSGQLAEDSEIPVERTSSPYDVVEAFEGLATTSEEIDTDQLADSLSTLADLTRNTPEEFRDALTGVSALSTNIAAKNEQIGTLLQNLTRVTKVLDERDTDIVQLMKDSDVLFRSLVARRDAVHRLLVSTSTLSKSLTALVRESRDDLKPALAELENVLRVLNKNEDNLDNSLRLMAPFYRVFASTLGGGPWFDTYIQNLPPVPDLANGGGVGGLG